MAELSYNGLTKMFDDGTVAVDSFQLEVDDGEFVVLVGPSGCGKTTTLMMTAGLEDPTSGEIYLDGNPITTVEPKDRDIAMVFQSYALYPHMTVEDNIAFGLRRRRVPKPEVNARVAEAARKLDLEQLLKRKPGALSGGQRQRVAMGRAMVRRPRLFLMDEPLSNLDAKLRVQMRAEIKQLQRELGVTTIYVTHDQTEAMTMGDRIAVMRKGLLEQFGRPHDLYRNPSNIFVAQFIGSPAMNLVKATVDCPDANSAAIEIGSTRLKVASGDRAPHEGLRAYNGRSVVAGFRPEALVPTSQSANGSTLPALVEHVEDIGSELIVYFQSDFEPIVTEETREIAADVDEVAVEDLARTGNARSCIARFAADTPVSVGDRIALSIDIRRLHVFDADSGEAVPVH